MSDVVHHRFPSPKTDGADPTQIQPSHWNDGHRFTGGNAGEVLTRDPSDATYGATWAAGGMTPWTPYAVQWLTRSGTVALGNGTLSGRYMRLGNNTVFVYVQMTIGSTSTFAGSDGWYFSLPFAQAFPNAIIWGYAQQAALGHYHGLMMAIYAFTGMSSAYYWVNPTIPFTWAAGDLLILNGFYEGL